MESTIEKLGRLHANTKEQYATFTKSKKPQHIGMGRIYKLIEQNNKIFAKLDEKGKMIAILKTHITNPHLDRRQRAAR